MKRTPFLTRILSLMGTVVAVTLTPQEVEAGTMHSDLYMSTYMDYGQNKGRYVVGGGVNALLSHIRTNVDKGITIHYTDGTPSYTISNEQGMISYMGVHDGGYATAIAPNFLATVAHNGEIDASFSERVLGAEHAINYAAVGVRSGYNGPVEGVVFRLVATTASGEIYDYMVQRQTKIFTDVTWNPVTNITAPEEKQGDYQYHAGAGAMHMWSETDGKYHFNSGSLIGSLKQIETATSWGNGNFSITSSPNYGDGVGATVQDPMPHGTEGGDSGSPVFIYNTATGQYEYIAAHQSGGGTTGWGQARGNVEFTLETLQRFNVTPDMGSGEVHLHEITHAGDFYEDKNGNTTLTYYGYATDAAGNVLGQYTGMRQGLNTWADLSGVKDMQNWYAYDANAYIQQSDVDLFFSSNLVFTAKQSSNSIVLDSSIDLGIGYVEFNSGELEKASFTITSAEGEGNLLNSAGYVINEGAEVHLQLTNPADYMYEWRKNGAGDLYIDGTGNTNALLALGGSGTTYLQQKDGAAAYNVLVGSGASVVINDINQIQRDFTFGNGGGVLDMNGNSMDWYTTNTAVKEDGFSINALTEEALIANTKAGSTSTLTFKQAGEQTYLGSFADTEDAALVVDYQGGGTWTLHSIHTDMSNHAGSGLIVSNGQVVFSGIHTVHGRGSAVGHTAERLERDNDWHYADAVMNVQVKNGAAFELGSHARLTGDVTVAQGGTFIMREGVKDRYEYVEGGVLLEDTYQYSAFYGLHGDVNLSGTMLVEYSTGTTANTTLEGNISGNGTLTVKAGTTGGTLTLAGDNSELRGVKEIVSGGVIATTLKGLGNVSESRWLIGSQGWLASHEFTGSTDILSYIDTASTGTLALSNNLTTELDLSNHQGLFIGAEAGKQVEYGTAGKTLTAINGAYKLGGGGGELIVNFKLTGDSTNLVLGADSSSTGIVTLANAGNDFGGTITFAGAGITLNTVEGALGQSIITLSYGNAMIARSVADVAHLDAASEGLLLLNQLPTAQINTAAQVGLAVGASADVTFTGTLTVADGAAYRLGATHGATLTLGATLSDAHDLLIDAQGGSGGTVKLAGNDTYAGDITVQGHKDSSAAGDITLAFGRDTLLGGSITLNHGATMDIAGHTVTVQGNMVGAGGSVINSGWTGPLDEEWTGELVFHAAEGQQLTVSAPMTVPSLRKTGTGSLTLTTANTYTNFHLEGGSLILGHESAASIYGTVHMSGGTTLDLTTYNLPKNTFLTTESIIMAAQAGTATVLQSGAQAGHISTIGGDIVLGSGSQLNLVGEGTYAIGGTKIGGSGAVLHVDAPQLNLNSSAGITIGGTLSFAGDAKLYSNGENAGMTRNIEHLSLAPSSTLTLAECSGTSYWSVGQLSGSGTLQWDSTTNQYENGGGTASRLVLKGENDFEGHLILNRNTQYEKHTHGAYIELAHDKAAQYADITLTGKSATGWASLAVNTADATIMGLSGNEFSFTFAGAAGNTVLTGNSHPTSTRKSILTLNTDAGTAYTYAGVLGNSADTLATGLDIVKLGAGSQAFTGTAQVGHVTVGGGTLSFSPAATKVMGNITLDGGTLSGINYTLAADKSFTVNNTSTFSGTLTLAGGQFIIDALAFGEGNTGLTLGGVALADGTTQTITLTNALNLGLGTYTLATGNWTSMLGSLSAGSISGYDTALSTNASGHLQLVVSTKNGTVLWDGTSDSSVWSSTRFGSSANALGENSIALFKDTAANTNVSVTENITVAEAEFTNVNKTYTITSGGGTATAATLHKDGEGEVILQSGMLVTGTTTIDAGTLTLQGQGMLTGPITGEGTLKVDAGSSSVGTLNLDNLHTLQIASGSYGTSADAALSVRNIRVQSGASYVQGTGVEYTGNTILEGGTIVLNGGSLTGSMEVNADSYLNIATGSEARLNLALTQNDGAAIIQTGGGVIQIVERGKTILQNYVVREGTLRFLGWGGHNNQGILTVEGGAKLQVAWGAGLQAEQINLKSGATLQLSNGAGPNAWWLQNYTTANILVEDGAIISGSADDVGSYIQGTISGSGTLNLTNAASVTNAKAYKIESTITDGSGTLGLNIANTAVTFTGANTYSGGTVIDMASSVTTAHTTALGSGAVQNAGALVMDENLQIGGLSGAGSLNTNGHILMLTNSADYTFSGAVTGQGAIAQMGSGTSTFSGNADLAAVGVTAGHLILSGASNNLSEGAVVSAGGELTLGGHITLSGMVENAGAVNIAADATFSLQLNEFSNGAYTLVAGNGSVSYADTLTEADFTISGQSLSTITSQGIQVAITQSSNAFTLTFLNGLRDLTWKGTSSSNWNAADANWASPSESGLTFGLMDYVTFDNTASRKDVTIASGMLPAYAMTVSGTGYTFTGMIEVQDTFRVEEGASATLNTMPSSLAKATVLGELTLAFGGTWTQDVDASAGTIRKTGTSTLTWNPAGGTLQIGTLDVQQGYFMSSSAMEIGAFSLGTGAVALLTNTTTADAAAKNIQQVLLGNNSYFCIQDMEASSTKTAIGEVVMMGAMGEFQDYASGKNSYIGIDKLSLGEGISSSTLTLSAMPMTNTTVYELGAPDAEGGNFAGTIVLKGNNAHAALILSGAQVASQAVVNLNASNSTYFKKALGINVDNAEIAGLVSAQSMGNDTKLFSGTVTATKAFSTANITNAATRNLIINTAAGQSYTFYGEVLQGVNLTKTGAGTQAFAGTVGSAAVTVLGGTLDMTAATLANGALAEVTLARGGQLSLGSLNLTTGKSLSVMGDDMSSTAMLSGSLTLGGGNLTLAGAALDGTTAALTVGGGISLAAGSQTITLTDVESLVQGNSYYLIAGSFADGITADSFNLAGLAEGYVGTLSLGNGGLWLTMTGSPAPVDGNVWAGTEEAHAWDATTFGTAESSAIGSNPVVFDDSAAHRDVLLNGSVEAAHGVVFNNAEDYTINFSNINSSLNTPDMTLNGEGTVHAKVALNADVLRLNNGKLVLSDYAVLGADTALSMTGDAVMNITSTTQTISNLSMAAGTRIEDTRGTGTLKLVAADDAPMALQGVVNVGTIATQGSISLTTGDATHTLQLGDTNLTLDNAFVLSSGKAIEVLGQATLNADITMAGGTLLFDNAVLSDSTAALSLGLTPTLAEDGKVNIAVSDLAALSAGGTFVLASGDWSAFSAEDFTLTGASYAADLATFAINGTTLSMTLVAHDVWAGTAAEHSWNTSTFGPHAALGSSTMAIFDNSAEHSDISLTESVQVGDLRFDNNKAYSITATQPGATITGNNFTKMGSGEVIIDADVNLSGDVNLTNGNVTFAGTTQVGGAVTQTAGTVTLSGDDSVFGDYTIRNASTLNIVGSGITMGKLYALRQNGALSTINIIGGTATFSSIDLENYTALNFLKPEGADSAEYEVTGRLAFTSAWATGSTSVLVEEGVKLKLGSIHSPWGWGTFDINGEVEVAGNINLSSGTEEPISGTGSLKAGSLTLTNSGIYIFDLAQTTISGEVSLRGGRQTLLRSGVFTSESKFNQTGSTLRLEGGELRLNGTSNFTGGTLQLAGGKMTLQSGTTTISNTVAATGGTVELAGGNLKLTSTTASTLLEGVDKLTLAGGTLDLSAVVFGTDSSNAITLKEGATFNFTGGSIALGTLQQGTTYHIFDATNGTLEGWTSLSASNFEMGGVSMNNMGRVELTLGAEGSFAYTQKVYDLTWVGGSSNQWNATDANWDITPDTNAANNETFYNGDSVTFASDASLTVAPGVNVNNLTLGANTTLTTAGALTVNGAITAATGSKWVLDGSATAFTQSLTNAQITALNALEVGAGATLQVSDKQSGFNPEKITGSGKVVVGLTTNWYNLLKLGEGFTGETYVTSGWFDLTGARVGSILRLASGVNTNTATGATTLTADLILEGTSTIHANSGNAITYAGTVTGAQGELHTNGGSSHTFQKEVNLDGINTDNTATLTFQDKVTLGTMTLDANATVNYNGASAAITDLVQSNGTSKFNSASATVGTLKLTGGTLQVIGGELSINAVNAQSNGGALSVSGGSLALTDAAAKTLLGAVNSFTLSSGTLDLADVTFSAAADDAIALKNGATFSFAEGATIDLSNLASNTTYHIFDLSKGGSLSGWNTLGVGNFTLGGVAMSEMSGIVLTLGADGTFSYSMPNDLVWAGGVSTQWNTSDANWDATPNVAGDAMVAYSGTNNVTFSGTGTTISIAENVTPASITVSGSDYVFTSANNGKISGAATLRIINGGSLTIQSAQRYTGGTIVEKGGTLVLETGGQAGALVGSVDVYGVLKLNAGDVTGWGTGDTITAINVYEGGVMNVSSTVNQTGSGLVISLQGGRMTGASGANFDLARGGSASRFGAIRALAGATATAENPTYSTIDTVSISLRQDATTISVDEHAVLSISSAIAEKAHRPNGEDTLPVGTQAGLTKSGAGELRLSGNNTYTQATTVQEGTLTLLSGGRLASAVTVAGGATFKWDAATQNMSYDQVISGSGALVKTGSHALTLNATTASTFSGSVDVQEGTLVLGNAEAAKLLNSASSFVLGQGSVLDLSALNFGTDTGHAIVLDSGANISLAAGVLELGQLTMGETYYIFSGAAPAEWGSLTLDNFTLGGQRLDATQRVAVALNAAAGTFSYYAAPEPLTWVGGSAGVWNTTDASWDVIPDAEAANNDRFYSHDSVIFATKDATITLNENVTAGSMTVEQNLNLTGNGTITVDTLTINANLTGGSFTGLSSLHIAGHNIASRLSLHDTDITMQDGCRTSIYGSTIDISGSSSLIFGDGSGILGSGLTVKSGTLEMQTTSGMGSIARMTVESGAVVNVNTQSGTTVSLGTINGSGTLSMTGEGSLTLGNATLGVDAEQYSMHLLSGATTVNGAVNLAGGLSVGQAMLNISSGAVLTTAQLTAGNEGDEHASTINIDGGELKITGTNNEHSTGASFLVAHYQSSPSVLSLNSGKLTAADTVMHTSWGTGGTFKAMGGEAALRGINLQGQLDSRSGSFELGAADSGSAVVTLGSYGINGLVGTASATLGHGTLKAAADFAINGTNALQLVATEGSDGTIFDTNGHTITVNTVLSGAGQLVKRGEGTLSLTAASSGFTGSLTHEAGSLVLNAASASVLESANAFSMSGGVLDLSGLTFSADVADAISMASGSTFSFTGGSIALGELQEGTTYHIFDAATHGGMLSGWTELDKSHFSMGGVSMADMDRVQLTLGETGTLTYTHISHDLTWVAGASGVWNTTDANWDITPDADAANNVLFYNRDNVTFATAGTTVTLNDDVTVGRMTVDATLNMTGSGTIAANEVVLNANVEGLQMTGIRSLVLGTGLSSIGNSNLTLQDAAVEVHQNQWISTGGSVLNFSGNSSMTMYAGSRIMSGDAKLLSGASLDLRGTGRVNLFTLADDSHLTVTTDSALVVDKVSGSGSLMKYGQGSLEIRNDSSSFSGLVAVEQGSLMLTNASTTLLEGAVAFSLSGGVLDLTTVSFTTDSSAAIALKNNAYFSLTGGQVALGNLTQGETYHIFDTTQGGTLEGWTSLSTEHFVVNGQTLSELGRVKLDLGETGTFAYTVVGSLTLTWAGGATGEWNTADTNWDVTPDADATNNEAFYQGDSVIFDTAGAEVIVREDVTVQSMTVNKSLQLAGNGTIAVESMTLNDNLSGGTFTGLKELYIGGPNITSNLSLQDARITLKDGILMSVSGSTIDVSGQSAMEFLGSGTVMGSGFKVSSGTLNIHSGSSAKLRHIEVAAGATLNVDTAEGTSMAFNTVKGAGELRVSGAGETYLESSSNEFTGSVVVENGSLVFYNSASTSLLEGASSLSLTGGVLDLSYLNFGGETPDTISLAADATFSFTGGTIALGDLQEGTVYHIFDTTNGGTLAGWDSLGVEHFTLGGAALQDGAELTLGSNGTFSYMVNSDLTWDGGATGNWNTTATNWDKNGADGSADDNVVFVNGRDVIFASGAVVSVAEGIQAGDLTLKENVTLTTAGSLSLAGTVVAESGSKWVLDGTATAFTQSLTGAQVAQLQGLEVGAGVTLQVSDTQSSFTPANISGAGIVELNLTNANNTLNLGTDFTGETYVKSGKVSTSGMQVGSTLRLANGVNMLTHGGDMNYDLVLEGTTNVSHNDGSPNSIFKGSVTGNGTFEHSTNGYYEFHGTVNLAGFINRDNMWGRDWFKGTTIIGDVELNNGHLYFEGDSTITTLEISSNGNNYAKFADTGTHTVTTVTMAGGTLDVLGTTSIGSATISGGTVNFNGATSIGMATISGGTTEFKNNVTLDTLNLNGGTLTLWNTSAGAGAQKLVDTVKLANGTTLKQYSGAVPNTYTALGTVELTGAAATIEETNFGGGLSINTLKSGNTGSSELTLKFTHSADNFSLVKLGAASAEAGNFVGTIKMQGANNGTRRAAALIIDNANIAKNAVVDILKPSSATAEYAVGINADNTVIAGLNSTADANRGNQFTLFSGAINLGQRDEVDALSFNTGWIQNAAHRTLTFNVAEGGNYTFTGNVVKTATSGLNLVKTGAGNQTISGVAAVGSLTVQEGTLALTNAASTASGDITVSGGSLTFAGSYTLGAEQVLSVLTGTQNAVQLGGLTLSGGELVFDAGSLSSDSAALSLGSAVVYTAGTTQSVMLDFSKLSGDLATGSYLLAGGDWSGADNTTLSYNGMGTASLEATANGLYLHYTHGGIYTWVGGAVDGEGAANNAWSAANWDLTPDTNADNNVSFAAGKDVIFNTNANVMVDTAVVVGVATVQNGAQVTLDKSGDSASLTAESVVVQDGKLTLGGGKNWTGISEVTVLADGVLELAHLSTLTGADITLRGGEMQLLNGAWSNNEVVADIMVDGTGSIRGSYNGDNSKLSGTISGVGTLNFHAYDTYWNNLVTVSSLISDGAAGPLSLHVTNGTVKLTGANTYTGGTIIDADGKLTITQAQALGDWPHSGNTKILGDVSGEGTLVIQFANASQVAVAYDAGSNASNRYNMDSFTGTIDIHTGTLYVGNLDTENTGRDVEFGASKVIVRNGSSLMTHMYQSGNVLNSDIDLMSGATLGNRDGHITYAGDIRFNLADVSAGTFNENGSVNIYEYWCKTLTFDGVLSGAGTVKFQSPANEDGSAAYVLTNGNNTFSGTYEVLNGSNASRTSTLVLQHQHAAKDATIALNGQSAASTLRADTSVEIAGLRVDADKLAKVSVGSQAQNATITAGSMTLGAGSTLTVDATTLSITDGVTQGEGSRVLGTATEHKTTTIIPTNGGVLDDRGSFYAVGGTLNIGDDDATNGGTVYVKGLALMGNGADYTSTLNVKSGNTFVITGTANTGTADATVGGKNYGDFQITAYDGAGQYNRNQNTVINVEGTLTANSRFSVAGGTGTFNVRNGGTVNMLDGTAEGGASTAIIYNVDNGGRVNIASYESGRAADGDNNVTLKLADGATVGGIADSSRGEEIYMLQKVEVGGTATIDTDAATYDTTSFVVTETDNGSDMVFTRDITSKQGTDDAVLKVAGHGTAHVAGTATLTGGVQVEADATLAVSGATVASNPVNSSVNALATLSAADGTTAATMDGAVRISHTGSSANIVGTGDEKAIMHNSLITIAQGASLTVDNMIISESSRISGRASAATFAAREAATPNVTLTNSTIELGNGNAELAGGGAPITINPGKLTSMDGSATDVWMTGPFTALSVESSALDSLTLNAGSSFVVDFSSLLADVGIDNIDLIELSFSGVAFESMSDITISGVYNGQQLTAYFHTPHATGVPNVGSMYFAVDAIPEPTSTTLSLLALAALVTRRRRK